MNTPVRNLLLSAFSWSPDRLVKLQRWLQISWISGCTKSTVPFPEPCDECEEVLCSSQELLDTLLLQQGNWEWKPKTGEYSSGGWCSPFFPQHLSPGLFLSRRACLYRTTANISHNMTVLHPLTTRGRNLGTNFNTSRLSICTFSKVPKTQNIFCFPK